MHVPEGLADWSSVKICRSRYTYNTIKGGASVAITSHSTPASIPASLVDAMERGELSDLELFQVILAEAKQLGLRVDDAVKLAYENNLPATPEGFDLQFHIFMLLS